MAGDWIKMRHNLSRDPRVVGMARELGVTKQHVVGCLHLIWSLADAHAVSRSCPDDAGTIEGHLSRYTPAEIDSEAGQAGFAAQLQAIDWLRVYADGVGFPDWDEHHSKSAKTRACEQKKKKRQRTASPNSSRRCPDGNGTKGGTREEKRRSKPHKPLPEMPEQLRTPEFIAAWERWQKYRHEKDGHPMTPSTVEAQYRKLAKMALPFALASIEQSITNGWTGLFTPKGEFVPGDTPQGETAAQRHARQAAKQAAEGAAEKAERERLKAAREEANGQPGEDIPF